MIYLNQIMNKKKIYQRLNPFSQCQKYNIDIWQCPSFLFPLSGLITIVAIISTYFIAVEYASPEIVALIVIGVATLLIIIDYFITKGFENLAQTNQLKSEFVNITSHQLRTPLTGIKWTIDLMRKSKDMTCEELLERLDDIEESNQRMIKLVNDLLHVAKIEQGGLNSKPEDISLDKIINDLIREYKPLADASNIKIILEIESNIPSIKIDFQGVSMLLRNLIDNAIKYTKKEGLVKIRLTKKRKSIRCEIEDNGVGIPEIDKKNIFEKFFRSQNIMKYQTIGSGLGLFIAKSVIEISNGKIGFWSRENKGTTFWFELPIN